MGQAQLRANLLMTLVNSNLTIFVFFRIFLAYTWFLA